MQHSFFVHFFAVVLYDYNVKLHSYTFYGGNVVRVRVHFFSLPFIFTLHWWLLAFLILSLPLQNFCVVLPIKICLLCFLFLCSKSLSPFFSLSFTGLPPTFSFFCLSLALYSKFVDMTIYLLNTLDNMDTETISAFCFHLY